MGKSLKTLNRFLCAVSLIMIMAFPGVVALAVGAVVTLCQAATTALVGGMALALCTVWGMCLAFPAACTTVGMLLLLALSERS